MNNRPTRQTTCFRGEVDDFTLDFVTSQQHYLHRAVPWHSFLTGIHQLALTHPHPRDFQRLASAPEDLAQE